MAFWVLEFVQKFDVILKELNWLALVDFNLLHYLFLVILIWFEEVIY